MRALTGLLIAAVTAILALTLGLGAVAAASSASGSPAPDRPDLALALLVADDLPAHLASVAGPTHYPAFDFDEASYDANGGLDKVLQTWDMSPMVAGTPVVIVFDFRFLFPSADAAQGYLDAAEPILSESVTGITRQPVTATVGDVLRYYAGSLSQGSLTVEVHNFLFRSGPVVAKVYVGGFETTLDDALPIAQAAAGHIDAWLAGGPAPSPSGSSGPAPSPSGSSGLPTSPLPSASLPSGSLPSGGLLRQWASDATASSQYGADAWWAHQATGVPNVEAYADDANAWAPANSDGSTEWLELTYPQAVVPTGVNIVETFGNGAVTLVEAIDPRAGDWVKVWSGNDPSAASVVAFSPQLKPLSFATDRLRITLDTDSVPGWNEIDAVELVGLVALTRSN